MLGKHMDAASAIPRGLWQRFAFHARIYMRPSPIATSSLMNTLGSVSVSVVMCTLPRKHLGHLPQRLRKPGIVGVLLGYCSVTLFVISTGRSTRCPVLMKPTKSTELHRRAGRSRPLDTPDGRELGVLPGAGYVPFDHTIIAVLNAGNMANRSLQALVAIHPAPVQAAQFEDYKEENEEQAGYRSCYYVKS